MINNKLEMHNIDFEDFLSVVQQCKGAVYLETDEGDSLNLKSKLCQMIGLVGLIKGGNIKEISVRCELPEDETKLFRFNLFNEV